MSPLLEPGRIGSLSIPNRVVWAGTSETLHGLRCWRTPRRRLLQHAAIRIRGGLAR